MNSSLILSWLTAMLLFIVMPFVFSPGLQDVEQTPRFLFLSLVVTGALLILTGTLFIKWKRNKNFIVYDRLNILFFTWLIICSISLIQSINFNDAVIELLKIMLFVAIFFVFLFLLGSAKRNRLIFYKTISAGALVFISIGIYQSWSELSMPKQRELSVIISYTESSLGNKNFFAETLLLMLPFTFLCFLESSKIWKIVSGISLAGIILELMVLQTLSTWVAVFTSGFIVLLIIYQYRVILFKEHKLFMKWAYVSVSMIVTIVLFTGFFFYMTDSNTLKKRYKDVSELLGTSNSGAENQSSVRERLIMWNNAVKIISDNPVNGVGLANLKIIAPVYGLGNAKHIVSGNIVYTHPHNEFLLVACESGLPGLIIYLCIFIVLIFYTWKLIAGADSRSEAIFYIALLFMLICFIIIAFVSLPSTRFYPMILLMLAAALIITERNRKGYNRKLISNHVMTIILLLLLIPAMVSVSKGKNRLKDDLTLSKALLAERRGSYQLMKKLLLTIDRKQYPIDVNVTPVAWYLGFAEFYLEERENAFEHFKEAEKVNPNHLMVLNDLGTSYNLEGNTDMAITYYQKALNIQPEFSDALVNLSIVYFNMGKVNEAYNTIIKHKTKISKDRIVVFKTIISAKATLITGTENLSPEFNEHFKSGINVTNLLLMIRANNGKLDKLL